MTNETLYDNEKLRREAESYICPACGAPMHFDPITSTLICDYCGNKVKLTSEKSTEELDFYKVGASNNSWQNETKVFHCNSCGADTVVSIKELSVTCPFCGSTQVAESNALPGFKPNRVIPFKVDVKGARTVYSNWLKHKFFVPSKVKKAIPSVTVNGIYLPMWTYDTNTTSVYTGRLGKYYTVTVGSGKNSHTETRIRWFNISGTKDINFDDLLVDAGRKVTQQDINSLSPFGTNDSILYDQRYLAGFSAEHYDIDVKGGWEIAKKLAAPYIKNGILSGYSYDVIDSLTINTNYNSVKYKYVLVPIWLGFYKYKDKTFTFKVNGETSKLVGKYPVSGLKVTMTIFGIIILVGLIVLLFMLYGQNA